MSLVDVTVRKLEERRAMQFPFLKEPVNETPVFWVEQDSFPFEVVCFPFTEVHRTTVESEYPKTSTNLFDQRPVVRSVDILHHSRRMSLVK